MQLSHVDRGVYAALDLRLARHPSETERYLLARLFAYCWLAPGDSEEDKNVRLEFSKGGLSSPEEPALAMHTLDCRLVCWVDVGNPSAERLHKASKAAPRVVVVTQHDPALLVKDVSAAAAKGKVHKVETIECFALDPSFLDAVAAHVGDRGCALDVTISEGELYVTVAGESLTTSWTRVPLA